LTPNNDDDVNQSKRVKTQLLAGEKTPTKQSASSFSLSLSSPSPFASSARKE